MIIGEWIHFIGRIEYSILFQVSTFQSIPTPIEWTETIQFTFIDFKSISIK